MSITTTKKILIVDDEEGIRESLKLVLGDHYDVLMTEHGEAALELLKTSHKDVGVMFMDIKMPRRDGLAVLTEIHNSYPHIKVIMVTGYRSVETAQEAVRLGASGYIVKPFKSEEILDLAGKYLKE